MIFNLNAVAVCFVAAVILLNVSPCTCSKNRCGGPAGVTQRISFRLKDNTGADILHFPGSVAPVPDSIKLRDARTGFILPLLLTQDPAGTILYTQQYNRPANIIDSLIFSFGAARPDTLLVYTALVDTWRGDECPSVPSPGITKVILRNQVLLQTTDDNDVFTLTK